MGEGFVSAEEDFWNFFAGVEAMTHVAAMAHVVAVTDACEVIGAANVHVAAVGHPDIVQAVVGHAAIGFWKQDASMKH